MRNLGSQKRSPLGRLCIILFAIALVGAVGCGGGVSASGPTPTPTPTPPQATPTPTPLPAGTLEMKVLDTSVPPGG
ncbi:MAG TPA: hypothetical protein VFP71_11545, partial [Candidatus Angelobacter sp.]|nr:hypothetical protein [Candidatus Angelobacter sp.]